MFKLKSIERVSLGILVSFSIIIDFIFIVARFWKGKHELTNGLNYEYDCMFHKYQDCINNLVLGPSNKGFTATLPMTTADMLQALTTAPLEYSYFDQEWSVLRDKCYA